MELLCPWEPARYLIFSSNVPAVLLYSHIPSLFIALLIGVFILWKSWPSKMGILLFIINALFAVWTFFDLILWATNRPDIVMFFWSLQILIEPLIYLMSFYLAYIFISKKTTIPPRAFLVMFLVYLPLIVFISSPHALSGVILDDCTAIEGFVAKNYTYIVELISTLGIIGLLVLAARRIADPEQKKEAKIFGVGIMLFLTAFSWGNIVGSYSNNWTLAQAGLIGMPIFAGFLAYSIVRYQTFNIKVIATQALVAGLAILVGAQFAFIRTPINRILNAVTFVGVIVAGIFLVRSVRREVRQREQLEALSASLQSANDKLQIADRMKTQFLSFASHQVKSPMTVVKGYAELIMDGSFGAVPEKVKETAEKIKENSVRLIALVNNLLDLRKLEEGKVEYNMTDFDIAALAKSVVDELTTTAKAKGLELSLEAPADAVHIKADQEKIRQVITNLIDNSIKYTEQGSVKVELRMTNTECRITVSDTGIGIPADLLPNLFEQFNRGSQEAKKIQGTGLGLYIAKMFMLAHKGKVWAESEGVGKGSTFTMELPM